MSTVLHTLHNCDTLLTRTYHQEHGTQPLVKDELSDLSAYCPACKSRVYDCDLEELDTTHLHACGRELHRHCGKQDGETFTLALDVETGTVLDDFRCPGCSEEIVWSECAIFHFPLIPRLMDTLGAALKESM